MPHKYGSIRSIGNIFQTAFAKGNAVYFRQAEDPKIQKLTELPFGQHLMIKKPRLIFNMTFKENPNITLMKGLMKVYVLP